MKLSIIIAYYNAEQYIEELLNSLLDQGFAEDEIEIIVVDDESTHSVDVLKNYCQTHPNVHYVWQKNARQSAARNNGIIRAKGEYLYFCDNDDKVNRHVLKKIYDIAHNNTLDMLFFNRLIINEKENPPSPKMNFILNESIRSGQEYISDHFDTSTGPWFYIIRKEFVDINKFRFPHGVIFSEDVDFLANSLEKAKRVCYVDVDVYYWIQRPQSISHYLGKKMMADTYIKGLLWNIETRQEQLLRSKDFLPDFVRWINRINQINTFCIIHNAFRFLPYKKNVEILNKLSSLGEYPIKKEKFQDNFFTFFRCLMNNRRLWLVLHSAFQLLPTSIKRKC